MSMRLFTRRRGRCGGALECLLISVFCCMLIAVGAVDVPEDTSSANDNIDVWKKCFINMAKPPVQRHFKVDNTESELRLEVSKRITHQLFTHIFRVLLEEKLGYSRIKIVEYDDFNETTIVDRMQCYEGALNNGYSEINPKSMINLAVPVGSVGPVGPDFVAYDCIKDMGAISPPEYFGWFIPVEFAPIISSFYKEWSNDSLNFPYTYFKNKKFAKAFSMDDTEERKYIREHLYSTGKGYHCNDARCTNGKYIPDWCKSVDCATIIAPDFNSTQMIIDHINEMAVYAKVAWVGDRIEMVSKSLRRVKKPFVIMTWTPSDVVLNVTQFISVTMKRCDYTREQSNPGCFYEQKRPVTFAWQKIQKQTNRDDHIFDLLRSINFLDNAVFKNVINFYDQRRHNMAIPEIACAWINANPLIIDGWIEFEDKKDIVIGGIFPISGSAYTGKGIVKGAMLAVNAINNAGILPNNKLSLLVADGECRADKVMKSFIDYITSPNYPKLVGVLGPACSDTVEPLAGISKYYRTITISYSAEGGLFSDRNKYPYFMRTIGENQHYRYVYLEFLNKLGWKRVAALTEDGQKYTEYISHMQSMLENEGIKFISNEKFPRDRDKDAITKRLQKLKDDGARIIIADVFDEIARNIMCEAYRLEMTAKHGYVWFLPTWLHSEWYNTTYYNHHMNESVNCTTATMMEAINGYFAMTHAYFGDDNDTMQENITVSEWRHNYNAAVFDSKAKPSNYSGYAYDAVWVYAYALQKLLKDDPEAIDHLHSSNNTDKMVDIIKHLDFNGVSGHIKFRGGQTRFSVINVMQWYNGANRIVGKFYPNISDVDPRIIGGQLDLNKNAIVWLSNKQPEDGPPPELCTFNWLSTFLNVSCQAAIIIANIAFAFISLVLICLVIYYFLKKNYDKKMSSTNDYMKSLGLEHLLNSNYNGLDGWEVEKENVVLNRKLGEGAFGTVYGGEALLPELGWTGVAVKTLKMGSSTEEKLDFLSEAEVMKRFDHKNIVKLLGVCTKVEPVYTIMEFMLYGDLKTYLLARRHMVNYNEEYEEVSSKRLTSMALDVARGLSYLASMKYVHRDIASRNCLISEQKVVKLCDFGMTRPVATTYYRFNRKGMLPVRWMAPESLALGVFTTASDVWSYGVLLYEIITFGSFPYQAMTNSEVLDYVKSGNSLPIPHGIKGALEVLLKQAWSPEPKDRPPASEIVEYLANNSRLISPCLDVPISSVQTEDSGPLEMQLPDTFRKCSSSTSFKNLPLLTNDTYEQATGAAGPQPPSARHYPKRTVSEPDQCDSGISIQMENCCPKAPLLPPRSESISEGSQFPNISPQHLPVHDSPPQRSLEDVSKDYIPCSFVNGHAISKV